MKISVVIPTVNRTDSLVRLIRSILLNTILPQEIFVVEQGDATYTQQILEREIMLPSLVALSVLTQETKSASLARQYGADVANGDVICFFDDDITIDSDYIEQVQTYMSEKPNCLGLTGAYQRSPRFSVKKIVAFFFGIYAWRGTNRVLPSGSCDFIRGRNLEKEQVVEFLYGCNMVVRKRVFEEGFRFHKKFIRWSFGEDVEFSHKIHKAHPGSLMCLPSLHLTHHGEPSKHLSNAQVTRMKIVYRYVFWSQTVSDGSWYFLLFYLWSQVGLSVFEIVQSPRVETVQAIVASYAFILKNHKRITEETIDYNLFILGTSL